MVHVEVGAQEVFNILGFPITNSLLMVWITVVVLSVFALLIYRNLSAVPSKGQGLFEIFIEGSFSMLDGVLGSREKTEKFFPLIASLFLMVLVSNWLGILPGVGTIGIIEAHGDETSLIPIFRTTFSDLNFTLTLAVISVISANIFGIVSIGLFKYSSKFISFKDPISFFVGILEIISEIAKMISFSFRLFGNIFAGEVLLVIILFLAPFLVPLPFMFLEIFIGFIQALVFSMLTVVFIGMATVDHH